MGKKLRNVIACIGSVIVSAAAASKTIPWEEIEASTKLDSFLGSNRAYRCYVKDRKTFDFSVGGFGINRYENLKRDLNAKGKVLPPEDSIIGFEYETREKEMRVGALIRDWALLDYIDRPPERIGHKATITLSDKRTVSFEIFAPVPDWPFTTRERLRPYFYLYLDGQKLKCGGIKQLD